MIPFKEALSKRPRHVKFNRPLVVWMSGTLPTSSLFAYYLCGARSLTLSAPFPYIGVYWCIHYIYILYIYIIVRLPHGFPMSNTNRANHKGGVSCWW